MINKGLFTSDKNYWETPKDFFNELHKEFDFTLDAAASHENAKLDNYYTVEENGLEQKWEGRVFVNPPYDRGIRHWVEKAYKESLEPYNECVVLLIPSRTDTRYWHDYIFGKASDIRFLKGRLNFELDGQAQRQAPFPSAVIVYTGEKFHEE